MPSPAHQLDLLVVCGLADQATITLIEKLTLNQQQLAVLSLLSARWWEGFVILVTAGIGNADYSAATIQKVTGGSAFP